MKNTRHLIPLACMLAMCLGACDSAYSGDSFDGDAAASASALTLTYKPPQFEVCWAPKKWQDSHVAITSAKPYGRVFCRDWTGSKLCYQLYSQQRAALVDASSWSNTGWSLSSGYYDAYVDVPIPAGVDKLRVTERYDKPVTVQFLYDTAGYPHADGGAAFQTVVLSQTTGTFINTFSPKPQVISLPTFPANVYNARVRIKNSYGGRFISRVSFTKRVCREVQPDPSF